MRKTETHFLLAALTSSLILGGCMTRSVDRPQGEGFGVVTHESTTDFIHWGSRRELCYWDKGGKRTRIWHSCTGFCQEGDVALFRGLIYQSPRASGTSRLFAVHGLGPPAIIQDDVFALWLKQSRTNLSEAGSAAHLSGFGKAGTNFSVRVASGWLKGDRRGTVELTREQVLIMIRNVEESGKQLRDGRYGTPYIQRDLGEEPHGQTRASATSPNQLAAANSRRPLCFRSPREIRCSPALSGLGSPAAVAEREHRDAFGFMGETFFAADDADGRSFLSVPQ